ncbi:hypothetical protein DPMN_040956 [Dreissena polymorpha]|uniref:Uncharacterized protein n=1 Tax=Dreissena polymorpha TaxID=45954 RepID=A0A9D4CXV9_DREPO|nr:hypothetical protein DPMN_040956 [Dreissena polymorpha]
MASVRSLPSYGSAAYFRTENPWRHSYQKRRHQQGPRHLEPAWHIERHMFAKFHR